MWLKTPILTRATGSKLGMVRAVGFRSCHVIVRRDRNPIPRIAGLYGNSSMANSAFARCQRFLGYHPLAKWLSIISSIGTALLYLGLIVLLGLFIDLMVERGEIPSFHQLPRHDRDAFLKEIPLPPEKTNRDQLLDSI